MKLFNQPIKKITVERLQTWLKKFAQWLQRRSTKIPVHVQELLLIIFCILVTVYCVLLILQPFIN